MDGIKSKKRVKEHGEVFTPDSIVCDMLSLVDEEYKKENITIGEYISKTYLEPACGNGNFLIRILDRKLAAVKLLELEKQETYLVNAVSSIYGIDIQEDNVLESRERLLELIEKGTLEVLELKDKEKKPFSSGRFELKPETREIIKFILEKNIVLGNALETDDAKAVRFINWRFDPEDKTVNPKMFLITNVDDELELGNLRNFWWNIKKLNYTYDDSTEGMDF